MRKIAFVTGGSRGIGAQIVRDLVALEYFVVFSYNNNYDIALDLTNELGNTNTQAVKLDISDNKSAYTILKEIIDNFGHIDILVNNAGISSEGLFTDMTEDEWDNIFNVNVKGIFNITQPIARNMISQHYGRIINISSMWGQVGASCEVAYSATKASVIGFTKALAKELAPSGITVNCICPGVIQTDMLNVYSKEDISMLRDETPVGRIGNPIDISRVVSFLASENSDFITGQVFGINGGFII